MTSVFVLSGCDQCPSAADANLNRKFANAKKSGTLKKSFVKYVKTKEPELVEEETKVEVHLVHVSDRAGMLRNDERTTDWYRYYRPGRKIGVFGTPIAEGVIKGGAEGKKAAAAVMWEGKLLPAWYIPCAEFAKQAKFGTAVQLTVDELALALLFKADFVRSQKCLAWPQNKKVIKGSTGATWSCLVWGVLIVGSNASTSIRYRYIYLV